MRRATYTVILLLLAFAAIVGCNRNSEVVRLKVRPENYQKIVSLSPSTTEILAGSLGVQSLAGRTEACNYPEYAVKSAQVVASTKPDYEKISLIRPDLIVYDAALFGPQDVERIKKLGAAAYGISANNLTDFRTQVFELANLVGGSTRASEYLDKISGAQASAQGIAPTPARKVAVILPSQSGQHMIAAKDSFVANVVKAAGGEPVGPDGTVFVPIGAEALVGLNPDVIIVSASANDTKGAEALLRDPRLKTTAAIRNRQLRAINSDILLRRGARVEQLVEKVGSIVAQSSQE